MISLAICTYNRCRRLREALNTLVKQKDLQQLSEVLVIDNNSTDTTKSIALSFASRLPIRYVFEASQGLAHARNRAIEEFKSDVLLFTDDDVRLDVNWLTSYASAIDKYPRAQFFGGRILPLWCQQPPRWFRHERLAMLDGVLVWHDCGLETRPYGASEELPFGASFGARRDLIRMLGSFCTDLGRAGMVPGRGEETEFLLRARAAGAQGVYVGKGLCWHQVDQNRLSVLALYRYGVESGRAHAVLTRENCSQGRLLRVPLHVSRGLFQLLKGRGDRFRQCVINAGVEVGMKRQFTRRNHLS